MRWFILALGLVAGMRPAMANDFDYYVLALSWSPSWCAIEGDAKKNLNNAALTKILDGACMAFGPDFIAGIRRIARP